MCYPQVVRLEKEPKPEPKYVVKMPGAGRGNNPASHANLKRRAKKEQSENEEQPQQPRPQYGVMPNSISDVRDCAPMSSFLLMANPHACLGCDAELRWLWGGAAMSSSASML